MDRTTRGSDPNVPERSGKRETPRQFSARRSSEENQLRVRHLKECYEHAREGLYFESENPYAPDSDLGIMWRAGMVMSWCELNLMTSEQEVEDADYEAEDQQGAREAAAAQYEQERAAARARFNQEAATQDGGQK